ncbi:MAG TPA: DEAD/DEAH box helicase family protein [Clostridiales bacterium]|nr:DEAD/DEAH box helicase family protein [Clostridiales bacterium]
MKKYQEINIIDDLNEKIELDEELIQEYEVERASLYNKLYLSEVVDIEKPEFGSNNLILAPVGSGKSHLIEKRLIPDNCSHDIIYLTSNTALKDSVCPPNDNGLRKSLAEKGKSIKFYTSHNKKRYGNKPYNVHVMTYHEFGNHLDIPAKKRSLLENVKIIFCDEIHSLPTYESYEGNKTLLLARSWLFDKHEDKKIYYFTATKKNIDNLELSKPGTLEYVKIFDYLNHPKIRKYIVKSTYFINHIEQLRPHLKAKLSSFNYYGYKGLAFTPRIEEQRKISEIATFEGYTPIILWSINNEEKMSEEQLRVRTFLLRTGRIPEPYNLLIINGAMQEGWNLLDSKMRLAIMDTTDVTEQIQALGRIRRDIDLLICKTNDEIKNEQKVYLPEEYIDIPLNNERKIDLYMRLNLTDKNGRIVKWPTIKKLLIKQGYNVIEKTATIDGERYRVSVITVDDLI